MDQSIRATRGRWEGGADPLAGPPLDREARHREGMRLLTTFARAYPTQTTMALLALLVGALVEGVGLSALLPLLTVAVGGGSSEIAAGGLGKAVTGALGLLGVGATPGAPLPLILLRAPPRGGGRVGVLRGPARGRDRQRGRDRGVPRVVGLPARDDHGRPARPGPGVRDGGRAGLLAGGAGGARRRAGVLLLAQPPGPRRPARRPPSDDAPALPALPPRGHPAGRQAPEGDGARGRRGGAAANPDGHAQPRAQARGLQPGGVARLPGVRHRRRDRRRSLGRGP